MDNQQILCHPKNTFFTVSKSHLGPHWLVADVLLDLTSSQSEQSEGKKSKDACSNLLTESCQVGL